MKPEHPNAARMAGFRLSDQQRSRLHEEADARGVSVTWFATKLLDEALAHLLPAEQFSLTRWEPSPAPTAAVGPQADDDCECYHTRAEHTDGACMAAINRAGTPCPCQAFVLFTDEDEDEA